MRPNVKDWRQSRRHSFTWVPQATGRGGCRNSCCVTGVLPNSRAAASCGWTGRAVCRARWHACTQRQGSHASYTPQQFSDWALPAHFRHTEAKAIGVVVEELGLTYDQRRWGPVVLGVEHQHETAEVQAEWRISADELQLAPITHAVQRHWRPCRTRPAKCSRSCVPREPCVTCRWTGGHSAGAKRTEFAANLEQVGVSAWQAAPAAGKCQRQHRRRPAAGKLRLAEEFGLHFTTLFPELWRYQPGRSLAQLAAE